MKDGFKQTGSIKVWRFFLSDLASAGLAGSKTCLFLTTNHKLLLLSLSLDSPYYGIPNEYYG